MFLIGENLTGGYGGADILHSCTIGVEKGEIAVIVGPNGAGKSTAMKAMLGMLDIREGHVVLDGRDITDLSPQDRIATGVAFVPQTSNVFTGMSVEENLEMGAFLREDDFTDTRDEIYHLFPILKEKRNQMAGELSGGQRQQVAVGRALMTKPSVLMLDEPTAGVSPIVMDELFDRILEIRETGVAILMVEQNARQALNIADRGYVLVQGANRYTDTGEALLANPEVRKSFLGDDGGAEVENTNSDCHPRCGGDDRSYSVELEEFGDSGTMIDFLNALVLFSNFVLVPGLAYGSQLALGALGITLLYSILRFANFAHGDTMAFGTMVTILFTWWFQSIGIGLGPFPTALLALPIGIAATALFALGTDKFVYKHYRDVKAVPIRMVMASVGVMFMMNGIVRFIIGPNDQSFADGERFIIKAGAFKKMTGLNEGLAIKSSQMLTVVVAIVLMAALFWFLNKTRTGKSMRAFSDNEDLALLSGISPQKVVMVTWIIVAALATIAGVLYGLDKSFKPFTYFQLLLPMFAAAIVGGVGQPVGAILGGFVVAFSEVLVTYAYKKFFTYLVPESWAPSDLMQLLSTDYKFAVSFIILVLVLLVRPTGIMRGRVL